MHLCLCPNEISIWLEIGDIYVTYGIGQMADWNKTS